MTAERHLDWEGCRNVRDLGGLPATRWGAVVGCDAPANLTAAGWPALRAYGIPTMVDLRNPDRLHNEASFAALCGVSPIEASSGKTQRRRLNRGGDRQANSALYTIVLARLRWDSRTRDYVARRIAEGKTRRETTRCLKRYVARELYQVITGPRKHPSTA